MDTATRKISADEIETYNRDGVVCLRRFFAEQRINRLRGAIDRALAGSIGDARSQNIDGFALGADLHLTEEEAHAFIFDSDVGRAAADLLGATQIRLFKDHYFVKNAGAPTPTPWHHDLPYWCIDGDQIASFWIPLDVVDANNGAVQYVRGSHRWNRLFNPTSFSESLDARKQDVYEQIPDIDGMRTELDIVMFDVQPGDCVAFHAKTIHGATGNSDSRRRAAYSIRWAGNDVVYFPRPTSSPPYRDPGLSSGQALESDVFPVVYST